MGSITVAGAGGGRIIPGSGGANSNCHGGYGGSAGNAGSQTIAGTGAVGSGGGGWGASGAAGSVQSGTSQVSGAAGSGGKAIALNGNTCTLTGTFNTQFSTRVLGSVS